MIDPTGSPPGPERTDAAAKSAFERVASLLRTACGIHLQPGKEYLVDSRLAFRIRELELRDLDAYVDVVERDESQRELEILVDLLTTNKTGFFREADHFDHLVRALRETSKPEGRRITIWSAACSTGEEPFSIAIACLEAGFTNVHILATDISRRVIKLGRRGEYAGAKLNDLPPAHRQEYFEEAGESRGGVRTWRVAAPVRGMVSFAHLNLQAPWPMGGPFDAIFCRNVMMYFDSETQSRLVARLNRILKPTGYLYVGLCECLGAKAGDMLLVEPAVYTNREEAA